MKRHLLLILLATATAVTGCAKEVDLPNPTGEGAVRAINAIPTAPSFSFLIEERLISQVDFRSQSSPQRYDDLDYTFNFEVLLAGDSASTRVASQYIDVARDGDYTMLISGAIGAPEITLWEAQAFDWNGDETFYEVRFAHASPSTGPVDVYFLDPGVVPALGNQVATLSFKEATDIQQFETGEKVVFLTPAGDDTTILFESEPRTLLATTSYLVTLFDTDANDVGPVSVALLNTVSGSTSRILDVDTQPTGRFFHASIGLPDADIYIDDPLTTPVVAGHSFGDITGDVPIVAGDVPLTYTATGNVGSILIDVDRTITDGTRYNFYATTDPDGNDVLLAAVLDHRSIETLSRLSVMNTASNHASLDVYIVPEGELIDERFPVLASVGIQGTPIVFPLTPGTYDVYLTEPGEKNVYLGPVTLDMQLGDVTQAIIYDTVDPNTPAWVIVPPP